MESLTGRPNSRKNFRQSPKFRQLNQSFEYEKDWALKPTEGYSNDFILSLDDNLVKYHFPNFDRKNVNLYFFKRQSVKNSRYMASLSKNLT